MTRIVEPKTDRLQLRQWIENDRDAFAAMSSDPRVMEFFPATLTRFESDAVVDKCQALIAERGWGVWAVELCDTGQFIGMIGLHVPDFELSVGPCVEVLWRLARPFWGFGYATEGASAALKVGFEILNLQEIVSFTVLKNVRSRSVMEKLRMINSGETFHHPVLPEGSGLREHCLYTISRSRWVDVCHSSS
ncbi:MAG: N-acetyltransferase [Ketobacter sp.]|nr:MAG: N-acetyltransferase [Ketobacter sp.]